MGLPTRHTNAPWPACPGDPLPVWQLSSLQTPSPGRSRFWLGYAATCGSAGRSLLHHRQPKYASRRSFAGFGCLGAAYYLKHYNLRADYIKDWFRILNWERAEMNFLDFLSACPSSF
ncbi:MAG: Fe-Mn family superoxide dismutase [Christensenellales bacterium]